MKLTPAAIFLCILIYVTNGYAQWPALPNPNVPVTSNPTLDASNYWACSDNVGGSYTVWEDDRYNPGGTSDIFCQRIDKSGNVKFTIDGIDISTQTRNQRRARIIDDGNSNALIVWEDEQNNWSSTSDDIYAQKVDSVGNVIWAINGAVICNANNRQERPWIVSDDNGGAIIAWEDRRNNGATGRDIYAQRIDGNGNPLWAVNGVVVCNAVNDQRELRIIPDENGGAIIVWEDRRVDRDIYAQKINANGITQWTANGELVCNAPDRQRRPKLCYDGNGGAIFTWQDRRSGAEDIYAQRINLAGVSMWTANGEVICDAIEDQTTPTIVMNSNGGAVITWEDKRNTGTTSMDVYSQRIKPNGNIDWTPNGVVVCNFTQRQRRIHSTQADNGATLVTWEDRRNGWEDIYVEIIGIDGTLKSGTINGVQVCNNVERQRRPFIFNNGDGEWIVVWEDDRNDPGGNEDIYAQGLNSSILVALPDELISFTAEKLNKKVKLKWKVDTEINIEKYIIERSDDGVNFEEIISKKSKGNSSNNVTYVEFDNTPLENEAFYRLSSIDFNGIYSFSKTIAFNNQYLAEELPIFNMYPNPINGEDLHIEFVALIPEDASIVITDINGKTVLEHLITSNQIKLNLSLSKGIYLVSVVTPSDRLIQKLVVK